jgi:hypothetical protein
MDATIKRAFALLIICWCTLISSTAPPWDDGDTPPNSPAAQYLPLAAAFFTAVLFVQMRFADMMAPAPGPPDAGGGGAAAAPASIFFIAATILLAATHPLSMG